MRTSTSGSAGSRGARRCQVGTGAASSRRPSSACRARACMRPCQGNGPCAIEAHCIGDLRAALVASAWGRERERARVISLGLLSTPTRGDRTRHGHWGACARARCVRACRGSRRGPVLPAPPIRPVAAAAVNELRRRGPDAHHQLLQHANRRLRLHPADGDARSAMRGRIPLAPAIVTMFSTFLLTLRSAPAAFPCTITDGDASSAMSGGIPRLTRS